LTDLSHEALFDVFERVEQRIGVKEMGPEHLNENNRVLMRGAEKLGYRGRFLRHNRTDCLGCGYCAIGCAYDRKGDALTTYLAAASKAGARIVPDVHVDRVKHEGGQVRGVSGRFQRSQGRTRHALRVDAPTVVLAAGALESPMLWFRSDLPDPHHVAGRNLHLHPYVVIAGIFEETIAAWQGAPQSYVVDEFLNLDKSIDGGYLLLAGAKSVVLPYNDLVEVHQRAAGKVIEERGILANDPLFLSFHPQGTLRMGQDPKVSLVDSFGAAHGTKGLYVADASVFPTSVAVPPQISVMALATRTAQGILQAG
jgi:choline dehydrogenase-like flavoprotein